jgi:hypothetical protein
VVCAEKAMEYVRAARSKNPRIMKPIRGVGFVIARDDTTKALAFLSLST